MSGKAAVTVALKPGGKEAPEAPQKSFPFVLKKIMDIPPPNILEEAEDAEIEKEKLCSVEDVEGGGAGAASPGGGAGGGGGGVVAGAGGGVSASLTPAIWDKTIPYDGETFHLEYMDLDEFLLENGIPASLEEVKLQKTLASVGIKAKFLSKVTPTATPATTTSPAAAPVPASASSPSASATSTVTSEPEEPVIVTTLLPAKIEEEEEEEEEDEEEEEEEEEGKRKKQRRILCVRRLKWK
ncbi:hypothetical protein PBY51_008221 [Eleginops maclovinus]|uniref:Thyrotroph embryonic factor n=1 Tax=Eleginops maclovinus TaxID=56733 RepID=A0AAN7X5H7_ELEMC|nr:hypothetical protein PBY51_008221 [Eleginops maclovinus]